MIFWNRTLELEAIHDQAGKGSFGYVTGRRRIGKSALLTEACRIHGGFYHQAVEGTTQQQIEHLTEEIGSRYPIFKTVVPRNWSAFLALLSEQQLPPILVWDEYPYWVAADPTLPSLLQKWVDHVLPQKKTLLMISGSSQSMLHSYFLNHSSPLYGRASLRLDLTPLSYLWFCRALGLTAENPDSFAAYSLVGGVPHYWKLMRKAGYLSNAEILYYQPSATLSEEPRHLLHDEGITGNLPKAILDLVGRGVHKPSEIAARLSMPQSNLSRPLQVLLDVKLLIREIPFGESTRTTKKSLYAIQDPALRFYYGSYLPHRSLWRVLTPSEKRRIIQLHASGQWELFCREAHPGSARYWEGKEEIDLVAPIPKTRSFLVGECKWQKLSNRQEEALLNQLRERFSKTKLGRRLKHVAFRIFSQKDLPEMAEKQDQQSSEA